MSEETILEEHRALLVEAVQKVLDSWSWLIQDRSTMNVRLENLLRVGYDKDDELVKGVRKLQAAFMEGQERTSIGKAADGVRSVMGKPRTIETI
jgi:hypothetical protein